MKEFYKKIDAENYGFKNQEPIFYINKKAKFADIEIDLIHAKDKIKDDKIARLSSYIKSLEINLEGVSVETGENSFFHWIKRIKITDIDEVTQGIKMHLEQTP